MIFDFGFAIHVIFNFQFASFLHSSFVTRLFVIRLFFLLPHERAPPHLIELGADPAEV